MKRIVWTMLILGFLATGAWADGKVISRGIGVVRIPDQAALICFDGKTERLVIESAFEGEGQEFAWVVPVPSLPKVEAATPGIMPTLRVITGPRLATIKDAIYLLAAFGVIAGLLIWMRMMWRISGWDALTLFVLFSLLGGMILPALGGARGGATRATGGWVVVHGREIVGSYDTVTLSGKSGDEIMQWLNSNGYALPAATRPVLKQYAQEGWYFVAARLRRESAAGARAVAHPLSFQFETTRAVYPMRLTGVENGPVTVDLYVAADEEAAAEGFTRKRSAATEFDDEPERLRRFQRSWDDDQAVLVAHSGLRAYLNSRKVLTYLTGTLSPEQMRQDVYLQWRPAQPYREVLYVPQDAVARAACWAAGAFVLFAAICAFKFRTRYKGGPSESARAGVFLGAALGVAGFALGLAIVLAAVFVTRQHDSWLYGGTLTALLSLASAVWCSRKSTRFQQQLQGLPKECIMKSRPSICLVVYGILVPLMVGAVLYATTPKFTGKTARAYAPENNLENHHMVATELGEMPRSGDAAAARELLRLQAAKLWREMSKSHRTNPFTGQPVREEDSPGNYTIDVQDGNGVYGYYDAAGQRITIGSDGHPIRDQ